MRFLLFEVELGGRTERRQPTVASERRVGSSRSPWLPTHHSGLLFAGEPVRGRRYNVLFQKSTDTPTRRNDLCGNGDRDLLGRPSADVEADRRVDARELLVGHAFGAETFRPLGIRLLSRRGR
jgi:hypothetical protein